MSVAAPRRGRIRDELVLGLASVVLASGLATYGGLLLSARRAFDALVGRNDVEIARSYAASLAAYYGAAGSWAGVEGEIASLRRAPIGPAARDEARPPPDKHHPKDDDIPLVLTDERGEPLYVGLRSREGEAPLPGRMQTGQGEPVVAGGSTVGYVFFKSMILRSYNPQEAAFIAALTRSAGASVCLGLLLALGLGAALAARFARPVSALEAAVRKLAGGDLGARVGVARLDEIGSLAASFNQMAGRLQANEASRQNLLADIAHELRTPVSVIQSNLEMILDGVYAADEARLRSLYEETGILTRLIADLRSLSDLEIGMAVMEPELLSLSALAGESLRKLGPLFAEKGVALAGPEPGEGPWIRADGDKLRQVLRNILGNALKYAPAGSTVELSLERVGEAAVRLTVADEGEGVPPGDTERIFERFFRVDPSRSRESGGRGLGLAICRRIVESSGGRIGACNRPGGGLAVWFELPLAAKAG